MGTGGAGRALCVGTRRPGAGGRASLGRSLPSLAPPGGRTPGRPGNGAGVARNVPLGTAWLVGGEKVAEAAGEVREPRGGAGAAPPLQAGEGCFQLGAFGPGEGFILLLRPWRWGAGWACVQRKGRRGGQPLPERVLIRAERPAFGDADLGVRLCPAPRVRRRCGAGGVPGPGLTKSAALYPAGCGNSGEVVFSERVLALGRGTSFLGCHFIVVIAFFFFKGLLTDA